jgi:hypothetical protein
MQIKDDGQVDQMFTEVSDLQKAVETGDSDPIPSGNQIIE